MLILRRLANYPEINAFRSLVKNKSPFLPSALHEKFHWHSRSRPGRLHVARKNQTKEDERIVNGAISPCRDFFGVPL